MTIHYLDFANGNDANDGSSWAQAWRTMLGVSTTPLPGDIVKVAKSPAPISVGNALWTFEGTSVELAAARTVKIDQCVTGWVKNTTGDVTAISYLAAFGVKATFDASPQINTMQLYKTISTLDLSLYDQISFFIYLSSSTTVADCFKICLCSDAAGSVVVDTFTVPSLNALGSKKVALTLPRDGGGNLGSNINSIAIYTGSNITGLASRYLYFDAIIACNANDLSYSSLISKNDQEQGGEHGWYAIANIEGATVYLGQESISAGGKYYGATETIETYIRSGVYSSLQMPTSETTIQVSGSAGSYIEFQGGYNTATDVQDGETFLMHSALNINNGLYIAKSYIKINRFSFARFGNGIYFEDASNCYVDNIQTITSCNYGLYLVGTCRDIYINLIENLISNNYGIHETTICYDTVYNIINHVHNSNTYGLKLTGFNTINLVKSIYGGRLSSACGVYISETNCNIGEIRDIGYVPVGVSVGIATVIGKLTRIINTPYPIQGSSNFAKIKYANISSATAVTIKPYSVLSIIDLISDCVIFYDISGITAGLRIKNHNGSAEYYGYYGNYVRQAATGGGTGLEWKASVTRLATHSSHALSVPLAKIAVVAGNLVTVSCHFKKSSATGIQGKFVLSGSDISYTISDQEYILPDDTNRNKLTLSFTPTVSGVFEVTSLFWSMSSVIDYVVIDDIEITQE